MSQPYKSVYNLLDVQLGGEDSDDSSSSQQDTTAANGSNAAEAPLSKKQRARRRAQERKASRALTPKTSTQDLKKVNGQLNGKSVEQQQKSIPLPQQSEQAGQPVAEPESQPAKPEQSIPAVTVSHEGSDNEPQELASADMSRAASSLANESAADEADQEGSEEESPDDDEEEDVANVNEGQAEAEAETGAKEAATTRAQNVNALPPGADHAPSTKRKAIITRTVWTLVMIAVFIATMLMGHIYIIVGVLFLQASVFRELVGLFDAGWRSMTHQPLKSKRGGRKVAEKDTYSKMLSWYFFAISNYFLYGESIIYYFKHIVLVDTYFLGFAKHHRFLSFMLWTLGFVAFVTTLQRETLARQFSLFCWIHMSLLLIVFSSHFMVNNILEGLIWFFVPASLVICNDIWAYICGMLFGRHQLIKLSPKKTVEGFVGALFMTVIFGYAWATFFMRYNYMICPCRDLGTSAFSNTTCDPNPAFLWRTHDLPNWLPGNFSTFYWAPFQLHTIVMAIFASLVAPFGGFFASGFKRAFGIKDFGDSIPGHGGMTDRMDCQFLMGVFAYFYYTSLVRIDAVSVAGLMDTIVNHLSSEDQHILLRELRSYLGAK